MRKMILLLVIVLAASVTLSAQSRKKQKPSAAVRRSSTQAATPAKTPSTSTQPKPASSAPAPATASTSPVSNSGPLYADEAGPLPAATATPLAKSTPVPNPSDLPSGTAIRMRLQTALSSRDSQEGDPFRGRVTEAVIIGGRTVIPVGASISGRLTRVSDPRRFAGTGSLRLTPESVMLPNGQSFAIIATMVDTSTPATLTVDDEGRIKSNGVSSGDKVEMIAGTGTGAIVGTIAGGGKGLLLGSMIGGGATVVHWLTKRHPVDVPTGTELIMEINRPMTVSSTPLTAGE